MKTEQIDKFKQEIEEEIDRRHYNSLVYVLFDELNTAPFAIHIFYRDHLFMVNSRDDRSYIIGKSWEFENYEEAKHFFIKKMETFVQLNRLEIQTGHPPYYPSPLWDDVTE